MRIEPLDRVGGAFRLGAADIRRAVQHLALQIGEADMIVVDHRQLADPGGGEIEKRRRADAAGADDEDARGLQLLLAGAAHFAQHDVAGVTLEFVGGEGHASFIADPAVRAKSTCGIALNRYAVAETVADNQLLSCSLVVVSNLSNSVKRGAERGSPNAA